MRSLEPFRELRTLILDHNQLDSSARFPPLPKLETLWVNHNGITNLVSFVDHLAVMFPHLRHLSMLDNPACPNYFNGGSPEQYADYRLFVLSRLKRLELLDDLRVRPEEVAESERAYGTLKHQLPGQQAPSQQPQQQQEKSPAKARRKHEGTVRREAVPLPEGPAFLPSPLQLEKMRVERIKQEAASTPTAAEGDAARQHEGRDDKARKEAAEDSWSDSDSDVDLADPQIRAYVDTIKATG